MQCVDYAGFFDACLNQAVIKTEKYYTKYNIQNVYLFFKRILISCSQKSVQGQKDPDGKYGLVGSIIICKTTYAIGGEPP